MWPEAHTTVLHFDMRAALDEIWKQCASGSRIKVEASSVGKARLALGRALIDWIVLLGDSLM